MADQRQSFGDSLRSYRGSVRAIPKLCQPERFMGLMTHDLLMPQPDRMPNILG